MGRRDAVQFTRELAAEWQRLGAEVTFESGWETRGVSSTCNYEGAIVHHTGIGTSAASPFTGRNVLLNGRLDLKGPLCNSAGPWCPPDRPRIHVIAAFPANHAGASGGRSMGPLPVTPSFNTRVWGHEVDYGGNVPMSPGQYTAALICAKGVASVLGRSIEYVRAHAETSVTGKWDPGYAAGKTIDMAAFRRDAAAYEGDEMSAAAEKQIAEIHAMLGAGNAVGLAQYDTIGARLARVEGVLFAGTSGTAKDLTVYQRMARVEARLESLTTGGEVDVQAVADQLTVVPKQ